MSPEEKFLLLLFIFFIHSREKSFIDGVKMESKVHIQIQTCVHAAHGGIRSSSISFTTHSSYVN